MPFEFAPGSNSPVRLRESIVAGEAPAARELAEGEVAVNSADGTLYCRDVAGAVKSFPSAAGFTQIVTLTESAYTALAPKVATTLYVVTPDPAP
jgi:hypothetical protein